MGASTWTVLSRYLFLNVIQSVPVLFTLNAADAILTLGALGSWGWDFQKKWNGGMIYVKL